MPEQNKPLEKPAGEHPENDQPLPGEQIESDDKPPKSKSIRDSGDPVYDRKPIIPRSDEAKEQAEKKK